MRARTTDRLCREVAKLRAAGTRVRVLTPDAAVLAEMGWNVMDPRRRHRVLDTALRSTAAAWAGCRGAVA
jgi:NTE family protein